MAPGLSCTGGQVSCRVTSKTVLQPVGQVGLQQPDSRQAQTELAWAPQ